MNVWCLLLVCVGAAMVNAEELSQFRQDKIKQHFILADCNDDGILVFEDYVCIVNNIKKLEGYENIDPKVAEDAWNAFPKKNITLQDYYNMVKGANLTDLIFVARNLSKYMYKAWCRPDCLKGMNITEVKNELISLGKKLNLDDQATKAMLGLDNVDVDGYVTEEEYRTCAANFLTLDNEAHLSKYFFGDLLVS